MFEQVATHPVLRHEDPTDIVITPSQDCAEVCGEKASREIIADIRAAPQTLWDAGVGMLKKSSLRLIALLCVVM